MPTVIALCSGWLAFCLVTAGLSKLRWSRATVATS
jgi:hypothetical protein